MFLACLSPSAVMIELRLVFGVSKEWNKLVLFLNLVVFADVQCFCGHRRPSVLCGETTQRTFPSEASPTSPYRLWVQLVAWLSKLWIFWQMPSETANNEAAMSLNQGAHTRVRSLGQARHLRGWALGRTSSHPPFFYCGNCTGNLLKLFCQFTLFSIHTIGIAWNAILLKVSIHWNFCNKTPKRLSKICRNQSLEVIQTKNLKKFHWGGGGGSQYPQTPSWIFGVYLHWNPASYASVSPNQNSAKYFKGKSNWFTLRQCASKAFPPWKTSRLCKPTVCESTWYSYLSSTGAYTA